MQGPIQLEMTTRKTLTFVAWSHTSPSYVRKKAASLFRKLALNCGQGEAQVEYAMKRQSSG